MSIPSFHPSQALLGLPLTVLLAACDRPKATNPDLVLGDTVPASVFEPRDSADGHERKAAIDSTNIFTIGEATAMHTVQLVSYPSAKDTLLLPKADNIKVENSLEVGKVCRVEFGIQQGTRVVTRIADYDNTGINTP